MTTEQETGGELPSFAVLVERSDKGILTQVYHKLTYTCQYVRLDSFSLRNWLFARRDI